MGDDPATTSLELLNTGATVEVRVRPTPALQELLVEIEEARTNGASWDEIDEQLIDAVLEVIVEHEYDGEGSYAEREIWEDIRDDSRCGPKRVAEALYEVIDPMMSRHERLAQQRASNLPPQGR